MCHSGGGVNNGRGCAYVETVNVWATCVPSTQFCCELKMTLKNKVYLKKNMYCKDVFPMSPPLSRDMNLNVVRASTRSEMHSQSLLSGKGISNGGPNLQIGKAVVESMLRYHKYSNI